MIYKIIPKQRELKQITNQYDNAWVVERIDNSEYLLTTVAMVHNNGKYPYSCWAKIGIDFSFDQIG